MKVKDRSASGLMLVVAGVILVAFIGLCIAAQAFVTMLIVGAVAKSFNVAWLNWSFGQSFVASIALGFVSGTVRGLRK